MSTDTSNKELDLLYISPKKATILLNPIFFKSHNVITDNQYEIFSLRSNDTLALRSLLRDLIFQADKFESTIFISTECLSRIVESDKRLLVNEFQFERKGHLYVRRPQHLNNIPYEIVAVKETDNGFTVVNNEYYATAFNVRNIYREVLASFESKAEAEILCAIDR